MMLLLLIILGIAASIVNANGWFIIPEFIPYVLFGFAGAILLMDIINLIIFHKNRKDAEDKFNKFGKF